MCADSCIGMHPVINSSDDRMLFHTLRIKVIIKITNSAWTIYLNLNVKLLLLLFMFLTLYINPPLAKPFKDMRSYHPPPCFSVSEGRQVNE